MTKAKTWRVDKECPLHGSNEGFNPKSPEHALAIALHDDAVQLYRLSIMPQTKEGFVNWLEVLECKIKHYRKQTK